MRRLREVLLNEYIGAVTIGVLLAQSAASLIGNAVQRVAVYLQARSRPTGMFGGHTEFDWRGLVLSFISVILELLVAYLLLYWLYLKPEKRATAAVAEPKTVTGNGETQG
jgi:divalent metal cation (Fe/Co/Zn/Cd) transporter